MTKRSATSSPVEEHHEAKKPKLDLAEPEPVDQEAQQEHIADDIVPDMEAGELEVEETQYAYTLMAESTVPHAESLAAEDIGEGEQKATKQKSKASEGFRPWRPVVADIPIPPCEGHWGIIPRPDGYWPEVYQPPACLSNGAVEPPLWEDRKGGVRVKRGDRFMKDYDQAYHLWIPLMNLRPRLADQQPKREPIAYQCYHGMPDWNDSKALTVVNKGIQNAIKNNSNKEAPYSPEEREILSAIFCEQPYISLLEAAKIFNHRAHPLENGVNKKGVYPIGRFTESIQHEYRIYQSAYKQGRAPTTVAKNGVPATKKDIPLEDVFITWTAEKKIAEKAEKDAEKAAAKAAKQAEKGTKTTEKKKKKSRTKKADGTKKPSAKMSESAGAKKTKLFRKGQTDGWTPEQVAVMEANAEVTVREREEADAAEETAKAATEDVTLQSAEPAIRKSGQPHLSEDDEEMIELAGGYNAADVPPLSRLRASARATVASPSHGNQSPTAYIVEQIQGVQTPEDNAEAMSFGISPTATQPLPGIIAETQTDTIVEAIVVDTQTTVETEVLVEVSQVGLARVTDEVVEESRVAAEHVVVKEDFVDKPAREVEIDGDYDEDEVS